MNDINEKNKDSFLDFMIDEFGLEKTKDLINHINWNDDNEESEDNEDED